MSTCGRWPPRPLDRSRCNGGTTMCTTPLWPAVLWDHGTEEGHVLQSGHRSPRLRPQPPAAAPRGADRVAGPVGRPEREEGLLGEDVPPQRKRHAAGLRRPGLPRPRRGRLAGPPVLTIPYASIFLRDRPHPVTETVDGLLSTGQIVTTGPMVMGHPSRRSGLRCDRPIHRPDDPSAGGLIGFSPR